MAGKMREAYDAFLAALDTLTDDDAVDDDLTRVTDILEAHSIFLLRKRTSTFGSWEARDPGVDGGSRGGDALAEAAFLAFGKSIEKRRAEVDRLGNAAVERMRQLRDAILNVEAERAGPLAFRERLTLDDIGQIAAVREGEAKMAAPTELRRMVEALIAGEKAIQSSSRNQGRGVLQET